MVIELTQGETKTLQFYLKKHALMQKECVR